jgi:hypothetical protein
MRRNKTISSLSIAAIALLAAAVPCFAQSQSPGKGAETADVVAAPSSGLELALNRDSRVTAPRTDTAPVVSNPRTGLTPAAFKTTGTFSMVEQKFSFVKQPVQFETPSIDLRTQFRTDDETNVERTSNRITFVPSRGPKFPAY